MRRETAIAEDKKIAPARKASPLARARAPIRLAENQAAVAASGGDGLDGHVTLRRPRPANSAACRPSGNGRRNRSGPSPSECRNRRIPRSSDRRSAIGRRFRGSPRAPPSTSRRPAASAKAHAGFRSRGTAGTTARLPSDSVRAIAGRRGRTALGRAARGAKQWMLPVSLTPIRFALPITALRDGAPSAAAMVLALFPSSAICLRVSIAASVHISHALRCFCGSSPWWKTPLPLRSRAD